MRRGLVECDGAVDVGGEALLSVLLLASLIPVGGSQVEHAQDRPIGQQAEEVAQVAPGFDAVQSATGQERDEGRIDRAALVAAEEEPVLPTNDFTTQTAFAVVVVQRQATVRKEARERLALVERITDRACDRRFIEDPRSRRLAPGKEALDNRLRFPKSYRVPFSGRAIGEQPLDAKQRAQDRERLARELRLRLERLEVVAPGVRPASDFDHV